MLEAGVGGQVGCDWRVVVGEERLERRWGGVGRGVGREWGALAIRAACLPDDVKPPPL